MKITICIGSSCHLRGSKQVIDQLTALVDQYQLKHKVELCGSFCLGKCSHGVSVQIDDQEVDFVNPEDTEAFFQSKILGGLENESN